MKLKPGENDQRRRTSVEQAEADYFDEHAKYIKREDDHQRRAILQKPMGFNNPEWEELKQMMQSGDELWEFCTSKKSWREHMGIEGIELIRNGEVIATIIGSMN